MPTYAKAGLSDRDIFWTDVSKQENYWTVGMNQAGLIDSKGPIDLSGIKAQYAIMDTGVSYSLVPSHDFQILVEALESGYGLHCVQPSGEQSMTSVYNCKCEDYSILPSIRI